MAAFAQLLCGVHRGSDETHLLRRQRKLRAAQNEIPGAPAGQRLYHGIHIRSIDLGPLTGLHAVVDDPHQSILLFFLRDQEGDTRVLQGLLVESGLQRAPGGQNPGDSIGKLIPARPAAVAWSMLRKGTFVRDCSCGRK